LRIAKVCDKEAAPCRPNPKGRRLKSGLTAALAAHAVLPSLAVPGVLSSRLHRRIVSIRAALSVAISDGGP
jgi:hypothetical protein